MKLVRKKYINWLEKKSLLYQAAQLAGKVSGHGVQWRQPYALPQTNTAVKTASVWFSAYSPSIITRDNQNILQFLGDSELWKNFAQIGINALHTGPMKRAGGIVKQHYTPTVDGWFDRIGLDIDPTFGDENDYSAMTIAAQQQNAIVAGDIIPGHTGKGADFLLALRNYKDYPGIYDLVEIREADWHLLPEVENEWDSVNLDIDTINILKEKGYIPGQLERVLFSIPGAKRQATGWDATGKIKGADGKIRRWVYLHYFKPGQPTMNWLDPMHSAERIIGGDIIKSILLLKNKIVRLDANPFLGIEPRPNSEKSWSEGHPLSITSSNNIAWLVRKLGGWSFQELNLTLDSVKAFSEYGPDLSYDFISRPALQHAVLTKDATLLRFMLDLMKQYEINPKSLIHDMQNHDEITYELVHFLEHADDEFEYENKKISGKQLRDQIVGEMHKLAISDKTPYNRLSGNGLCTTFIGLIATRLNISDIYNLDSEKIAKIQKGHLAMAIFNAMQPGIFGLSGWDLVGALPLPPDEIKHLIGDGDFRWLNRGAYDLLDINQAGKSSKDGVPKAKCLYGSILNQLKNPNSFISQIKNLIAIRKQYKIDLAEQIAVPEVKNKGAVIMAHQLPENLGYEITAINFGGQPITETFNLSDLNLPSLPNQNVIDLLINQKDSTIENNVLTIKLDELQGKVLLVKGE